LRREERTFSGVTAAYVTSFHYDGNGNRSRVEYPSGMAVTYAFDFADRPTSAVSSGANFVTSAAYLPFGPVTSLTFGNGTSQLMTHDNRYRLLQNKLLGPAGTLAQYDYAYDAVGNVTQIHDGTDPGFHRDFGYDDLNRLITANTGLSLWRTGSYSYDAMGNMLTLKLGEVIEPPDGLLRSGDVAGDASTRPLGRINTFAYQGSTPRLAAVTLNDLERPVTYDGAGNELSYAIGRSYSARNHMASVTEWMEGTLHRIDYSYDGRGIRVKRSEPPATGGSSNRFYVYSPELQLLSVTSDDAPNVWLRQPDGNAVVPTIRTEIVWFGGRPVAQVAPPSATLYTFTDHLGTPILQTNTSATIVWRAEYEPFGNIYEMCTGNRTDQPLRFPGQEVAMALEGQEESYNIFRWYKAGWGRYTQADPIGLSGGLNLYGYVKGNPLTRIDPLGQVSYNVAPPVYRPGTHDETVMRCNGSYVYGCTELTGRIDCDSKCSGDSWRASVSITTRHFVNYATDTSIPGDDIRREEEKHVTEDRRRLEVIRREGQRIEARRYSYKFLCEAECRAYEIWSFTMLLFSGPYTHVTDPHEYP